jgi:hypothetical protein
MNSTTLRIALFALLFVPRTAAQDVPTLAEGIQSEFRHADFGLSF